MLLGRSVERTQQCAALHPRALANRIDANRTHRSEVDHQARMRDRMADDAMSATPHADLEPEIAAGPNSCLHVRDIAAANDESWSPVDHRIPDGARGVVAGISRYEHVAIEGRRQAFADHVTMT